MFKTLTKEKNRKTIIVYYALALISVSIGLYSNNAKWYIMAVAFILVAMFRKYWLMKKLK